MELQRTEIDRLQELIQTWIESKDFELESTFDDVEETTTFTSVYQRLQARGFSFTGQELKLNILTPEQIRFSVTGDALISKYCADDTLDNKLDSVEILQKQNVGERTTVRLEEYGVKVKLRQELSLNADNADVRKMLANWPTQKKAFRLIQRWSFLDKEKDIQFDLSVVRSTPKDMRNQFLWQTQYKQQNLSQQPAKYEVEVELKRPSEERVREILGGGGAALQGAAAAGGGGGRNNVAVVRDYFLKRFIAGVGEVLRGIQKHSILITKKEKREVLTKYADLLKFNQSNIPFRGVAPVTLMKENMEILPEEGAAGAAGAAAGPAAAEEAAIAPKQVSNIRTGYNVTDKADGLRMMGFVDDTGELFMIDMSLSVYRTGLIRPGLANSLVDGEYVTKKEDGTPMVTFFLFDMYVAPGGRDLAAEGTPFEGEEGRHANMSTWVTRWNERDGPSVKERSGVTAKNKIRVALKTFLFAKPGTDIFRLCDRIWKNKSASDYYTDGLILTPNLSPLPGKAGVGWKEQLKWKPSHDNSVDFLVYFEKDPDDKTQHLIVTSADGATKQYKSMRLFVGSSMDSAFTDPRGTILRKAPLPDQDRKKERTYKPVLFNPRDPPDTMASLCNREIEMDVDTDLPIIRCENGDPIDEQSIVEMKYDAGKSPGWRWIPMRVRYDKTERYLKGIVGRTMNKDDSANGVWESIHNPVTEHMICTGSMGPSAEELREMQGDVQKKVSEGSVAKVYYERAAMKQEDSQAIRGLRNFHRLYIKDGILWRIGLMGGKKKLVDLACGQGGDLQSWVRKNTAFVYGNDIAGAGIIDPQNGIYRRYLKEIMYQGGYERATPMVFTIGSSAQRISTGEAGATPEEKNIMRTLYGRVETDGIVPEFVTPLTRILSNGADCVSIMFALHYFFDNEEHLNGFLQNVNDSLALGGYFIGCCFDGAKVFHTLRNVPVNGKKSGKDEESGTILWELTKKYDQTEFPDDASSLGMPIDVNFLSIGTTQTEYLVNFEFLKKKMREIGCELMSPAECKKVGLNESTNTFDETYKMAMKNLSQKRSYEMSPIVQEYSFLNRWFIFKRRHTGRIEEVEEGDASVLMESASAASAAPAGAIKARLTLAEAAALEQAAALAGSGPGPKAPAASGRGLGKATGPPASSGAAAAGGGGGEASAAAAAPLEVMNAILANIGAAPVKQYKAAELIQFFINSPKKADPTDNNIRHLDPISPFPIVDTSVNPPVKYPSVYHYYAAMKLRATNKPNLAASLFGPDGEIHNKYKKLRAEKSEGGRKLLNENDENELLAAEKGEIKEAIAKGIFETYKAVLDEGKWAGMKQKVLRDAYQQRFERDQRFREVIEKTRQTGKVLLYTVQYAPAAEDLGGRFDIVKKVIVGQNLIGRMLMQIGGWVNSSNIEGAAGGV